MSSKSGYRNINEKELNYIIAFSDISLQNQKRKVKLHNQSPGQCPTNIKIITKGV
jgi:hypothetical protein